MEAAQQPREDLRTLVARHTHAFQRGPGHGLGGHPHCFQRAPWSALPEPLRAACESAVGSRPAPRECLHTWLQVVPTGGYILPCRPLEQWCHGQVPATELHEQLLCAGPADGATIFRERSPHRHRESEGLRLRLGVDDWYWVSPVLGAERLSLVWVLR